MSHVVINVLLTGVVVAVFGMEREDDRGKFHVEDICFQDLPQQIPRPPLDQDKYVQSQRHSRSLCRPSGHVDDSTIYLHFCRSSASLTHVVIPITVRSAMSVKIITYFPPSWYANAAPVSPPCVVYLTCLAFLALLHIPPNHA